MISIIWWILTGFHMHEWTRYEKVRVVDENGCGETMQQRRCLKCGKYQTKAIYDS